MAIKISQNKNNFQPMLSTEKINMAVEQDGGYKRHIGTFVVQPGRVGADTLKTDPKAHLKAQE